MFQPTALQTSYITFFLYISLSLAAFAPECLADEPNHTSTPPPPATQTAENQTITTSPPALTLSSDEIKTFPVDRNREVRRVVVGGGTGTTTNDPGTTAGASSKLVYSDTLGTVAARVPPFQLIADDMVLLTPGGCTLDRFTFQVTGRADPEGEGGIYRVDFALYEYCPGAGGPIIAGTDGFVFVLAAQADDIIQIEVIMPDDPIVTLNTTIWLGLSTSRNNVGIIMGAPPLTGFSLDRVDFPGFACNANLGGFPNFGGHASFNSEVYVRGECPDAFPAYHNVHDARGPFNPGANVWLADDLELTEETCEMIAYEVGVRDVGFYTFEMLHDANGAPGIAIEGTRNFILNNISRTFKKEMFSFDPPITIDKHVWVAGRVGNDIGGWVLTGRQASLGTTATNFFVLVDNQWVPRNAPPPNHGGFHVTIYCAGQPPVGACCDMFIPDEFGESVCREVPEINCFLPRDNPDFQPQWVVGEACDPDPFPFACGAAACCKPFGADDPACENLSRSECFNVKPTNLRRLWEIGSYCNEGDQQCPISACIEQEGHCTTAHSNPGCEKTLCCEKVCTLDMFCCQVEWDETCVKEAQVLCNLQPGNNECAATTVVTGAKSIALGESSNTFLAFASNRPSDPGICCHGGNPSRCVNGANHGSLCDNSEQCSGGFCESFDPTPGQQGLKTVWYQFEIPQRSNSQEPELVSVELNTCRSNTLSQDTMLQVFQTSNPDKGLCEDLGQCDDNTFCDVSTNNCSDGSNCIHLFQACSVSTQDCPNGKACLLDLTLVCDQLSVIGCNDDAGEACAPFSGKHASLCLTDLIRGETYFVMVGTKVVEDFGSYNLNISEVDSCISENVANDQCRNAVEITDRFTPFDLNDATFSCPGEGCLPNMLNDVWFQFVAPVTGRAVIETCGLDAESTPNTEMVIYDSCECPPPVPIACSGVGPGDCLLGSTALIDIVKDQCYLIRIADNGGNGGSGELNVQSAALCPDGTPEWITPLENTVDARRPYPDYDDQELEGINTITVELPFATDSHCWELTETTNNPNLHPPFDPSVLTNKIIHVDIQINPVNDSMFRNILHLKRPITPGEITSLIYHRDFGSPIIRSIVSHPGDVNGDDGVCADDVEELLRVLEGRSRPRWKDFSADIDHSGEIHPADILQLIDLMNGASAYDPWLGTTLHPNNPPCP